MTPTSDKTNVETTAPATILNEIIPSKLIIGRLFYLSLFGCLNCAWFIFIILGHHTVHRWDISDGSNEFITENLRDWFKDKWVRFGPDGKIRGDCARGSESEGKPKCLPQSKAHALGKKGRASAAARKRRKDPNANRSGPAINVSTKGTKK